MRNAYISIILIFVLLLILVCIIKQKQHMNDSPRKQILMNNDINRKVSDIFVNLWFSGLLVKDRERLIQMIHPQAQFNTYLGRTRTISKILPLLFKIEVYPNYKIRNINITSTQQNMIISHDLYQLENKQLYSSTFTLMKSSSLKWRVLSWSYYPK